MNNDTGPSDVYIKEDHEKITINDFTSPSSRLLTGDAPEDEDAENSVPFVDELQRQSDENQNDRVSQEMLVAVVHQRVGEPSEIG